MIAGPEQHAAIQEIGGLMSLLEGHGDITMDRAGADRVPNAAWFSQVLKERRRQRGLAKVVSVLVGLDAKMQQYEQGERFIEAVEAGRRAGPAGQGLGRPGVAPDLVGDPGPGWLDRPGRGGAAAGIVPGNGSGAVSLGLMGRLVAIRRPPGGANGPARDAIARPTATGPGRDWLHGDWAGRQDRRPAIWSEPR